MEIIWQITTDKVNFSAKKIVRDREIPPLSELPLIQNA